MTNILHFKEIILVDKNANYSFSHFIIMKKLRSYQEVR